MESVDSESSFLALSYLSISSVPGQRHKIVFSQKMVRLVIFEITWLTNGRYSRLAGGLDNDDKKGDDDKETDIRRFCTLHSKCSVYRVAISVEMCERKYKDCWVNIA